jgi:myo-inositol-1(or 4)-monophosphatase
VFHASGLKTSDFLANDGLWKGNPILAGNTDVMAELEEFTRIGK